MPLPNPTDMLDPAVLLLPNWTPPPVLALRNKFVAAPTGAMVAPTSNLPPAASRMRSVYASAPTAPVNVLHTKPPLPRPLTLPPPDPPPPTYSAPPPLVPRPAITTVALPPNGFSAVLISKLPALFTRMRSAYDSAPTAPVNVPTVNPPAASALMLPPPLAPPPTSSIPPPLVPIPPTTTVALPPSGFSTVLISRLPALFTIMRLVYTSLPTAPVKVDIVNPPLPIPLMLPPPVVLPTSSIPPPLVPIPPTTTVALPPSGFSAVLISKLPALFTTMRLVYTSAPTRPVKVLMVNPPADIPDMLAPPLVLPPTSSIPPPLVPTPSTITVALPPSGAVDVPIPMLPVL